MKKSVFLICLLALTACSSISGVSNLDLSEATNEKIMLINKSDLIDREFIIEEDSFNSKITIGFSKERVYGSSGINRYFGIYNLVDNKLVITTMGSTMMAGKESAMIEEVKYLTLLKDNKEIKLEGNNLILTSNEGIKIKFRDMKTPKESTE